MIKRIQNINHDTFRLYGYFIEYDSQKSEGFQVVLKETGKVGWRIAVSKITKNKVRMLGKHPNSMESFEPLSGVTILLVALPETPENFEVFLLDRPVCLFPNIWHATLSLSEYSLLKVTENLEVDSDKYHFEREFEIALIQKQ